MKLSYKILFICCVTFFPVTIFCQTKRKKPIFPTKKITINSSGKNLLLSKGQIVILRLKNQVDGGYVFNIPQYNPRILHLNKHLVKSAPYNSRLGYPGHDSWQFPALRKGKTALKVTSSRPWTKKDSVLVFFDEVIIK